MVRSEPLPRAWQVIAKLVLSAKVVYGKGAKASLPLQTLRLEISVCPNEIDYCNWWGVLMREGNVKNEKQFFFHFSVYLELNDANKASHSWLTK